MSFKWSQRSYDRMECIWPYLEECADLFIQRTKYDAYVAWRGGVRTDDEQNDCFVTGASKADGIINLSMHQIKASKTGYGMALDIIPVVPKGQDPYKDTRKLNYFGRLMNECWQELIYKYAHQGVYIGIMVWGGTFGSTSWDRAHYEIHYKL